MWAMSEAVALEQLERSAGAAAGLGALSRCLSLDLEVGRSDERIHALAGVRPDLDVAETASGLGRDVSGALGRLDALAEGADFLLGHNVIDFDLAHLRAVRPDLRLLELPVVDTLRLNPLAFPRNPYHYLVKHYQDGALRRGRRNDPELDARLALEVLADQFRALRGVDRDLLAAWHWLVGGGRDGAGFDLFFSEVRGDVRPSDAGGRLFVKRRLEGACCRTQAVWAIEGAEGHRWELAYVLAWLSVAGGDSVVPPWVRHQFPGVGDMLRRLRDTACGEPECDWCLARHAPRLELKRWFGYDEFREGQREIVEAALGGEHVLGILPTGAGKSLCYQVPALSRYDKTGALAVVISPLVALMADQVAGLEARGIGSCVTVNGLLSMPERADALDRVRLGGAGILLISPEQLRSVSMRRVLDQREIGMWVLDEAHCLSRWGHDFRPDYRYVGRFIREKAGDGPMPPVLCLTATAKPDVRDEIVEYFRREMGSELTVFDGGARRTNLEFVVVPTRSSAKFDDIYQLLRDDLPDNAPGGAIVYCATRRHTEEVAQFLQEKGVSADYFHAGLPPETKKQVQESFIRGDLRAICATNAFGMGIDKPDVRLVIHADIPGSLENYLQEAGRAGRDQQAARCVLLYAQADVERQFAMSARGRLSRREIHSVLRALRNLDRRKRLNGQVVATSGEILREEEGSFARDAATDDTRVRTAVSWLEEADLLAREENRVQVFPSSLRVASLDEVRARLERREVAPVYRDGLLTICQALFDADPDEGVSTDELMSAAGMVSEEVRKALHDLEDLGIASNDTAITAFVHAGVEYSSRRRLQQAVDLEEGLIALMREKAPDQDKGDSFGLHLRHATQELRDGGCGHALPELVRRIIRSVAADGRGDGGGGGSLGLRERDREVVQVTLQRDWPTLSHAAELRRGAAGLLLEHLLSTLPRGTRGTDLLAETTMGGLLAAVKGDLFLGRGVRHPDRLMDRALLWLHEQEVIRLNKGLAVFRPAMTVLLQPGTRGFAQADFATLQLHYDEQVRQVHVMAEYAQHGLRPTADHLNLAMDYFSLPEAEFLERWLPERGRELARQTTAESWHSIVESLNNPEQRRIVADDREQTNVLVLAGPGSGKTRVLVHRIAYLVRVRRENPRGILALAYNRHAAVEIRRRLGDLIGDDARGVTVLTCHALAMRLVGVSFSGRVGRVEQLDFQDVMRRAASLLRGDGLDPEEAAVGRERLLAGFRWILVDEYQDIGPDEYDLISALAGRTLDQSDDRLSLFAVGDDDQNIYSFSGASTEFIRRFEADYVARASHLTDNYRSTGHIIAAANAVIEPARDRMKAEHPIVVNRARRSDPPGGEWTLRDAVSRGRVQVLAPARDVVEQARVVMAELSRMAATDPEWDWSRCAVMAREWRFLDPVRALCELEGVPVQVANEEFTGVWRLRETRRLLGWLRERDSGVVTSGEASEWLEAAGCGPWWDLLRQGTEEYGLETGGAETPVAHFVEWLADWSRDVRRRQRGLLLLTAHRAKGLEFDHVAVLDGGWGRVGAKEDPDAPRRLCYVAMTRARLTLSLARLGGGNRYVNELLGLSEVLEREGPFTAPVDPPGNLLLRYWRLSLRDVFLGYAGRRAPRDALHGAIASLVPGDSVSVRGHDLVDDAGRVVGRLAGNFRHPAGMKVRSAEVMAVATWDRESTDEEYRDRLRCDEWEVVVPELVYETAR